MLPGTAGRVSRAPRQAIDAMGAAIDRALARLAEDNGADLRAARRRKFLEMGRKGL